MIHVADGGVGTWQQHGWPIEQPEPATGRHSVALAAIPFGLAIGLAVGMLGGGGSVLAVPVLVYVLGQGVHEATTASLVVVTAGALAGGLGHARGGPRLLAPRRGLHRRGAAGRRRAAPRWATPSAAAR